MNDTLIISLLGFIVSMIPIVTIIVKLNNTLTKLNITIDVLSNQMEKGENDRKEMRKQLNDHETRIVVLEKK